MVLFLLTLGVMLLLVAFMAVGLVLNGRCLRGSCGGPELAGPAGEPLTCIACPRRKKPSPVPND